ncbi:acyl-CoA dehydrogenase family protein [Mycolicibacterium sp. HS_4_1]
MLRGIVAKNWTKQAAAQQHSDEFAELRELAEQIGRSAEPARTLPLTFDDALWHTAENSGLTRLSGDADAGPAAAAVVLGTLARHAAAVPIAETDVLATWLATAAGLPVPESGPLTLAIDEVATWPQCGTVLVTKRGPDALYVGLRGAPTLIATGHNLAGEPRATIEFDTAADDVVQLPLAVADELTIRGAWCRCVQIVGAFDAAAQLTVTHTANRVQFGRPLAGFQAVQHSLASMLGEIERARAATTLAVIAAAQYGFADARTAYATTVAKVAVGRAVAPVTTIAHQLHGAIGTTAEHPLWRATMRARSWADEFGSTSWHARRLAGFTATTGAWDVTVGRI